MEEKEKQEEAVTAAPAAETAAPEAQAAAEPVVAAAAAETPVVAETPAPAAETPAEPVAAVPPAETPAEPVAAPEMQAKPKTATRSKKQAKQQESLISVGKRKTSIARIYMKRGTGKVIVNKKRNPLEHLKRQELTEKALSPLQIAQQESDWDIKITVKGGGLSGQAGAIAHGLAKALLQSNEALRQALKQKGLLTRDSRIVERKKYGKRGARRSFQFSKR